MKHSVKGQQIEKSRSLLSCRTKPRSTDTSEARRMRVRTDDLVFGKPGKWSWIFVDQGKALAQFEQLPINLHEAMKATL